MSTAKLSAILEETELETPFRAFLISRGGEIVTQRNRGVAMTHIERMAIRLARTWNSEANAQVQFLQADLPANELIFYSCALDDNYLLSVGAITETGVGALRQKAEAIATAYQSQQARQNQGQSGIVMHRPVNGTQDSCYALIWQPQRPLPVALHPTLQQTLSQLAETNGCQLHHLSIQDSYIQILVACPEGRSSAWAAHLFKSGSEQGLQQRIETETSLWRPGYYASETREPLQSEDLKRIFRSDQS